MIAVVAIYSHPELYPPTLNAVHALSEKYEKIYLLCNNVIKTDWIYPSNVELIAIGDFLPIKIFEKQSILWKLHRFFTYSKKLNELAKSTRLILTYDTIPLMAYGLGFRYLKRKHPTWWYHNHDIAELTQIRKASIGWFSAKLEPFFFNWLNIFSLPSDERKKYFPLDKFKGKYFFIPNFPSINAYNEISLPEKPINVIKLIYQGSISKGHGLEAIIPALGEFGKYIITLTLIGNISKEFRLTLEEIAKETNKQSWLFIESAVSYKLLPPITSNHHIGLAIHQPIGSIYATGGTASNKIYEYAACGLPVLYLKTPHYLEHLGGFNWARAVELNIESIVKVIHEIVDIYSILSFQAREDFLTKNNYESRILPVINFLYRN